MNSENVDTEPSLQMHKLSSVYFVLVVVVVGWGGGGGPFFEGGGGVGVGYTLRKGQHSL